jgi:hypothetical protein
MLHIITLAYRFELLSKVYASIPKHDDIRWHLSIAKKRGTPNKSFILKDKRIVLHITDCEDNDFVSKRNAVFEKINDGYFYLLDDDTIFLVEVYNLYQQYSGIGFRGMIVGDRIFRMKNIEGEIEKGTYPTDDPNTTIIDSGMALASSDVLKTVKWQWVPTGEGYPRDYLFWSNCFKYFGKDKVVLCDKIISYYNYLNPIINIRINKKIKGIGNIRISLDIYNIVIARIYNNLTDKYFSLKTFFLKKKALD